MKRRRFLRLGLFQMAAGGLSVLFLGVLNRVMRVELGMDLLTVSLLVGGGHYLGAVIAIPFGYYSDRHPLGGYRRTAYVLLGALATAIILVASPFVVRWIAADPHAGRITAGFGVFLLEGIATYVAGTAYLALITDLTTEEERGGVTGMVWTLLMVGIILTGIGSGLALRDFHIGRVMSLFLAGGILAFVLAGVALWRQEPKGSPPAVGERPPGFRQALGGLLQNPQARWFGGFLFLSMFSYFMQDVILEPFGGEVFGLSPSQTARFNAYMGVGVVSGMLLGGMRLIPSRGKPWTTAQGLFLMMGAFAGLAASAWAQLAQALPGAILLLGLGAGFFTVGGVAMMMDMTSEEHTGLFVGAWTLIQALAKGPTAIAGGALQTFLVSIGLSPAYAYGGVFLFEAAGLWLAYLFLRQVGVERFRKELDSLGELTVDAL